jgi:hypothetical protein
MQRQARHEQQPNRRTFHARRICQRVVSVKPPAFRKNASELINMRSWRLGFAPYSRWPETRTGRMESRCPSCHRSDRGN